MNWFHSRGLKEINRLQKSLQPSSEFHKRRNSHELKVLVQNAMDIVQKLPCIGDIEGDLQLAWKGIVQAASIKKRQRPVLNIDEDLYPVFEAAITGT